MKNSDLYPTQVDDCQGLNPCAEVTLSSYECCNLSELYLNNCSSKEELIDCAKLLYKTQKAIAAMPFIHDETNQVVHKNMRLGLGVTGICQSLDKIEWLDECYTELRKFDKEWSKVNGWPESIKLTVIKPSGTLSLLAGATPGVHPAYSKYYIRRVRMSSDDKLVKICRDAGYFVEFQKRFDGSEDHGTCVVEFPCETPDGAVFAKDMPVIEQLEMVKKIQSIWADNAVSVTAYYKPSELTKIREWMKDNYETGIKSVSFLLHSDHGFQQAPYEEITKENYENKIKKVKPVSQVAKSIVSGEILDGVECAGGACPLR
jgi:ribonucleotide reductase alpha subunit